MAYGVRPEPYKHTVYDRTYLVLANPSYTAGNSLSAVTFWVEANVIPLGSVRSRFKLHTGKLLEEAFVTSGHQACPSLPPACACTLMYTSGISFGERGKLGASLSNIRTFVASQTVCWAAQ
jgi:hypothetical protein